MCRVKTNDGGFPGDILDGLPFQGQKDIAVSSQVSTEADVTERKIRGYKTPSEVASCTTRADRIFGVASEAQVKNTHEVALNWKDPQTGQVAQLDIRTGLVLKDRFAAVQIGAEYRSNDASESMKQMPTFRRRLQTNSMATIRHLAHYDFGKLRRLKNRNMRDVKYNSGAECLDDRGYVGVSFENSDLSRADPVTYDAQQHVCRKMLTQGQAISQVDHKFILARFGAYHRLEHSVLVLVDQHAADERCRVEKLFWSLLTDPSVALPEPLVYNISATEAHDIALLKAYFKRWQVGYELSFPKTEVLRNNAGISKGDHQLLVSTLPACVSVRCRTHPQLVVDMIREQAAREDVRLSLSTPPIVSKGIPAQDIPVSLLEMINSRACRSSIMFNDELDVNQCQDLLTRLSSCTLPFQCAHGRKCIFVLPDMPSWAANDTPVDIGYY